MWKRRRPILHVNTNRNTPYQVSNWREWNRNKLSADWTVQTLPWLQWKLAVFLPRFDGARNNATVMTPHVLLTDITYANQMNPMEVINTCAINSTRCLHWSLWIHVRYVTPIRRDKDRTSRWRCPTSVKWRSNASGNDASCATGKLRNKKRLSLSNIECVPTNVGVISPKNIFFLDFESDYKLLTPGISRYLQSQD